MVVQRFARFRTNLGNLRISQDICYVRMADDNDFLTVYGHCASLLNNKDEISAHETDSGRGGPVAYLNTTGSRTTSSSLEEGNLEEVILQKYNLHIPSTVCQSQHEKRLKRLSGVLPGY